jgi:hypothetical protein
LHRRIIAFPVRAASGTANRMSDYEIQRERIVERPVTTERVVEREVPVGRRRTVVSRGGRGGYAFNPVAPIIAAVIVVLLLLLILGALT